MTTAAQRLLDLIAEDTHIENAMRVLRGMQATPSEVYAAGMTAGAILALSESALGREFQSIMAHNAREAQAEAN